MGHGSPHDQGITLLHDSIVDASALNFPRGQWGTAINGQTFQQEALVSFNGHQYAAYFADGGVLCAARRALPDGPWQVIRLTDYLINHDDVHNVAVIGVCPLDGSIHLSFDHHVSPMHYRRSVAGVALEPGRFAWEPGLFGATTSELEPGKPLTSVTYPTFFTTPQGKLQLLYRTGYSGNGDWFLAEYDPARGGWTVLGLLLSREGVYENSPSRCAYPNPIHYDAAGRLHITWCWRERPTGGPTDLRTNHDLHYAFSDDEGRTWLNNDGQRVAHLDPVQAGMSISIDTPGIRIAQTRFLWGQMNTTTQYVDHRGRVHVINWQNPPTAAQGTTDLNPWRYTHYWRDPQGQWHERELPFIGRKPQIVLDPRGNACIVFCQADNRNYHGVDPGGRLSIAVATEASQWRDWHIAWESDKTFVGEPLLDPMRWAEAGILSVYIQEKPVHAGGASALHVLDFQSSDIHTASQ